MLKYGGDSVHHNHSIWGGRCYIGSRSRSDEETDSQAEDEEDDNTAMDLIIFDLATTEVGGTRLGTHIPEEAQQSQRNSLL